MGSPRLMIPPPPTRFCVCLHIARLDYTLHSMPTNFRSLGQIYQARLLSRFALVPVRMGQRGLQRIH
jgi:hypothetical protein